MTDPGDTLQNVLPHCLAPHECTFLFEKVTTDSSSVAFSVMPSIGPDSSSLSPNSKTEDVGPLSPQQSQLPALSASPIRSDSKRVEDDKPVENIKKESIRARMSLSPCKSLNFSQGQSLIDLQTLQTNTIKMSEVIDQNIEPSIDYLASNIISSNISIPIANSESIEYEIPSTSSNINLESTEIFQTTELVGSSTDCKKFEIQDSIDVNDSVASPSNNETFAIVESGNIDIISGNKSNRARKSMASRVLDSTYSGDDESITDVSVNGKNVNFEDVENTNELSKNLLVVRTKLSKKKWFKGGTYSLGGKPKNKAKTKHKIKTVDSSDIGLKKDDGEEEDYEDDSIENCDVSSNAGTSLSLCGSELSGSMESDLAGKSATMFTALVEKFNEKVLRGKRVGEVFPGQTKLNESLNIVGKSEIDAFSDENLKCFPSQLDETDKPRQNTEKEIGKTETNHRENEEFMDVEDKVDEPEEQAGSQEKYSEEEIISTNKRLALKRKAECDDAAGIGSNTTSVTDSEFISSLSSRSAKRKFLSSLVTEEAVELGKPETNIDKDGVTNKSFIPVCFCKLKGLKTEAPCRTGSSVYCQAVDTIDNRLIGCCNTVTDDMLVRPSIKIPFMAVCAFHHKQLQAHQCCPVCGHFCTQGKFFHCRKNGTSLAHTFHKECRILCEGEYLCPHCGEVTLDQQIILQLNSSRILNFHLRQESVKHEPRAKMSFDGSRNIVVEEDSAVTAPSASYVIPDSEKEISSAGLPLGQDRSQLETMLITLSNEKPMKLWYTVKSLYNTSKTGDIEKVLHMLALGFDPNHKFEEHENSTALHVAAEYGQIVVVHVLIQAGVSFDCRDEEMRTPLMMASETNQLEVIKYLVRAGAQVDSKSEDGMTCLHAAAKAGHKEAVHYLLDTGKINVNIRDDGGWTPLIWASEHKHLDCVKLLLERGGDPLLKDNECNIALHWSAFAGSVEISEIFLNEGCNLSAVNEHGDTPLHIAARQDHYDCVVLFLARGASVESRNNENETPIACCPDQNSAVWLALQVNCKLKSLTARSFRPKETILHKDISMGKEIHPIECINNFDDETIPEDYLYIIENCETTPMNINNLITGLQSCDCQNNCTTPQCNCSNISLKCWYDKDGHLLKEFNLLDPPMIFECNKSCRCWKTCYNRVLQNRIQCRLQLFRTEGKGWGVRTLRDIPQGSFICEYIGEMISDSEADTRGDDSYLFDLDNRDGETYCIDARHYGNISRFINHLCEPNVVPVKVFVDHQDLRFPRIAFFSSREIKAYEELGFDYGEKFWIIKYKFFTCYCRSPKCKYSKDTIKETLANYNKRLQEEQDQD